MDLVFDWSQNYREYLFLHSKGEEKSKWEQRIANTLMPCLAVPCKIVDDVARQIFRSDYRNFLEWWPWQYLVDTQIIGKVINKIKNREEYFYYLDKYVAMCDNWASTDCLRFNIKKSEEGLFLAKALEYVNSDKPFVTRVGLLILMKCFVKEEHIHMIFEVIESLRADNHYYVMMMEAWLLCECVIKQRKQTLEYIEKSTLSAFVINKTISKCRDSYRVSSEDKEYLKSLRRV